MIVGLSILSCTVLAICLNAVHKIETKSPTKKYELKPLIINSNNDWIYKDKGKLNDKIAVEVEKYQEENGVSTGEAIANVTYTNEDDIDLLARLTYAESGILNDEAQMLTASVVINRMNSPSFPDSIYGVIYQYGQYAVVDNGTINNPASEHTYEIAKQIYENGARCPSNVVYQAEFAQGSGIYKIIDGMYFCYE